MKRKAVLSLLIFVPLLGVAAPESTGSVQGSVVDENGRPVANVKVYPMGKGPLTAAPFSITDDDGNFELRRLLPGETKLFAVATQAGYPDGRSGIFTGDPSMFETVNIEPGRTLRGVVLKLPKKGGVFRAHIVDIVTGKPVLTSRIRITRADVPKVFYESGPNLQGQFEIVLVPNVPFRVEIRAANYKEWQYARVDSQGKANSDLVLSPEAIEEVTVKLQMLPEDQTH